MQVDTAVERERNLGMEQTRQLSMRHEAEMATQRQRLLDDFQGMDWRVLIGLQLFVEQCCARSVSFEFPCLTQSVCRGRFTKRPFVA